MGGPFERGKTLYIWVAKERVAGFRGGDGGKPTKSLE